MTNKERYRKMFDMLSASGMERLEAETVKRNSNKRWTRIPRAAAIALVLFVSVGSIAYAAARYYGILDFSRTTGNTIPKEAGSLIEKDLHQETEEAKIVQITEDAQNEKSPATETKTGNELFECSVKEALRDSETITIVYEVSAKEKGKYLFIPEDATPEDGIPKEHGSRWDYSGSTSIGEYAAQNKLKVINIGGGLTWSELDIVEQTVDFISPADDVMDVYIRATLEASNSDKNVSYTVTARSEADNTILKERIAFTLEDRAGSEVTSYSPASDSAYAKDLNCSFIKAEVIQTALGTYVDVFFTREKAGLWEEEITLTMADSKGDRAGGYILKTEDDEAYRARIETGKMDIGDSFEVTVYDIENHKELQTITFTKQK